VRLVPIELHHLPPITRSQSLRSSRCSCPRINLSILRPLFFFYHPQFPPFVSSQPLRSSKYSSRWRFLTRRHLEFISEYWPAFFFILCVPAAIASHDEVRGLHRSQRPDRSTPLWVRPEGCIAPPWNLVKPTKQPALKATVELQGLPFRLQCVLHPPTPLLYTPSRLLTHSSHLLHHHHSVPHYHNSFSSITPLPSRTPSRPRGCIHPGVRLVLRQPSTVLRAHRRYSIITFSFADCRYLRQLARDLKPKNSSRVLSLPEQPQHSHNTRTHSIVCRVSTRSLDSSNAPGALTRLDPIDPFR
jgi:hypothetical protein